MISRNQVRETPPNLSPNDDQFIRARLLFREDAVCYEIAYKFLFLTILYVEDPEGWRSIR